MGDGGRAGLKAGCQALQRPWARYPVRMCPPYTPFPITHTLNLNTMRRRFTWRFRWWLAGLGILLGTGATAAQPTDTLQASAQLLARFDEARRVAVDPAGKLYVADTGRDGVVRLRPDGGIEAILGGPGAGEGQFDDPMDVDPTNGLVLIVADAGNGRLQRFSRDFLFLEALPVPAARGLVQGRARSLSYRPDDSEVDDPAEGRPIAVVSTASNETFAIDELQGQVLLWDAARRLVDVIGGFGAGVGRLIQPVALAADDRALYVADQGHDAVLVYDLKGQYMTTFAAGQARDVQSVAVAQEEVWIVLPELLLVYDQQGRLLRRVRVLVDEPLQDVAVRGEQIWVLTATALYALNPL